MREKNFNSDIFVKNFLIRDN